MFEGGTIGDVQKSNKNPKEDGFKYAFATEYYLYYYTCNWFIFNQLLNSENLVFNGQSFFMIVVDYVYFLLLLSLCDIMFRFKKLIASFENCQQKYVTRIVNKN